MTSICTVGASLGEKEQFPFFNSDTSTKLRSKTLPVGLNPRRLPHAAFADHRRKGTQEVTASSACG